MKNLNILVTGGGSPGIAGTLYSLRNNYDHRSIRIVCTDAKQDCVGKYLGDSFYQIPKAADVNNYLERLYKICTLEKIDVILPQNTAELFILSENKEQFESYGVNIVVSSTGPLSIANNKFKLLKICDEISVPFPEYYLVDNKEELMAAANKIGWPKSPFVVKPPTSNGSRGIRIIDENKDFKDLFYNEKPTNLFLKFNHFLEIIGDSFEPLLLMEYLPGEEITIDLFRDREHFISIQRKRDEIKSGISFQNSVHNDDRIQSYSKVISDYLDLHYCFGYQFKYDLNGIPKILECNPRVQGTMIFSTFMGANIIYSSIKSILGENIPELSFDFDTKLLRYWGALGINKNGIIKI